MSSQHSWVATLIVMILVGFVTTTKEGILVGVAIALVAGAVFKLVMVVAYFVVIGLLYGGLSFLFGRRTQQK